MVALSHIESEKEKRKLHNTSTDSFSKEVSNKSVAYDKIMPKSNQQIPKKNITAIGNKVCTFDK